MLKRFVEKHLSGVKGDYEFPLRQPYDLHYFLLSLIFAPAFFTALLAFIIGTLIFPHADLVFMLGASCLHFVALIVFLALFWLPVVLVIFNFSERAEMNIIRVRTFLLLSSLLALFPHSLFLEFLVGRHPRPFLEILYWSAAFGLTIVFGLISNYAHVHTAFRDVRMALSPDKRTRSERHLWFDTATIFMVFFAVIVIETWFTATMSKGEIGLSPYEGFLLKSRRMTEQQALQDSRGASLRPPEAARPDTLQSEHATEQAPKWMLLFLPDSSEISPKAILQSESLSGSPRPEDIALEAAIYEQVGLRHRMYRLTWLTSAVLCALCFFLSACLPNRLMHATLIPVTFHEQDLVGVFFKAHRYLYHFGLAMLLLNPMLILGGLLITIFFLALPAVCCASGRLHFLDNLAQADETILVLGVFLAWLIPLARSVINPDETFGEYFNRRLSDHMMMVQGHIVFIGYGELGKRVLDREINRLQKIFAVEQKSPLRALHALLGMLATSMYTRKTGANNAQAALREKHKKAFFEIVTPDLRLEYVCGQAVVIDRSSTEVIYSGGNSLLGSYGVVGTCRRMYKSKDLHGQTVHPEKRLLVPMIIGEAKEPFISSRVNLERASLLTSMVPDEESVQAVFERAIKTEVPSIICVTRSDQISYLTYRSRHHPVILVYPKHNQGITLGERLWAAIIKVRNARNMQEKEWPRILVAGNHKANHYMMEKLWTNLPGSHNDRVQIVKNRFAFIVTAVEEEQEHPVLQDASLAATDAVGKKSEGTSEDKIEAFDQGWPATYITGSRYPYPPPSPDEPLEAFRVPSRLINTADIAALQDCLEQHNPDILVINHVEAEKSLFMLSRCMRALERIKSRKRDQFRLPFLLLAAARGDEWERLSMGDASLYYDALCHIYKDELSGNLTYPQHARYDHFQRVQIGESIIDSLADVEEMIAGARATLIDPQRPAAFEDEQLEIEKPPRAKFIEVHGCLPNRPGALANYISQLSGITYERLPQTDLERLWRKTNALSDQEKALIPSYQYLRYVTLDPQTNGFALSGYASLAPIVDDTLLYAQANAPQIARIFANDGRNYVEPELDPDAQIFSPIKDLSDRILKNILEPKAPGVPQVLDRLTARGEHRNTVAEFHENMLDTKNHGTYACPGMNICSIAAFQDYVLASNSLRLQRYASDAERGNERLFHSRNYHCCTHMPRPQEQEMLRPESSYARIFCCCRGKDESGILAMVLNALLFRFDFSYVPAKWGQKQEDWVINIKYFKDVTCQNNHFTLNRLFGSFASNRARRHEKPELPLHLLRILPIGGAASARHWYYYARTLQAFLNELPDQPRYRFYWMDENRKTRRETKIPAFIERPYLDFPIVLVIEREDLRAQRKGAHQTAPGKNCALCGVQAREYDCSELRVWV